MNYIAILPKDLSNLLDHYLYYNYWMFLAYIFKNCLSLDYDYPEDYDRNKNNYRDILNSFNVNYTLSELSYPYLKGRYILLGLIVIPSLNPEQIITYEHIINILKIIMNKDILTIINVKYALINEKLRQYNFGLRIVAELPSQYEEISKYSLIYNNQIVN